MAAVFDGDVESELSNEVSATPVLIDITAPQNPYAVINHGAFMTNTPEVVVTISANDVDTGVGAYFVSEAPMTPMAGTPGWVDVTPAIEVRRDDSVHSVAGRRAEDDLRLVQGCRRERVHPGQRHDSGQYLGLPLRVRWGRSGRGASLLHGGEFMAPIYGLCVDQQGALFVVDNGNNRVQKFDNAGNFIILWGNFGAANANFHNPTGIACDGKGDVWVVDTNNHRVQKFDGKLGGYLMKFGSRGNGEGQFNSPWGIAVDRVRGYVYVVDSANFRVQKFDMTGEFIMSWGSFGNGDGQFYFPRGIAVDQSDGVGLCRRHGQSPGSEVRHQHERAASDY